MKKAKDQPTINTIPKGAYESGITNEELRDDEKSIPKNLGLDAQRNGYPSKNE